MNFWELQTEVNSFPTASKEKKEIIINYMFDKSIIKFYNFSCILSTLLPNIDSRFLSLKIIKSYIQYGNFSYASSYDFKIINNIYYYDKKAIRTLLKKSKHHNLRKILLSLDDLTIDDEIIGLRSLSRSKHPPHEIFEIKYAPSLDALKSLPTVMRLNTIETLLNNVHISYNIFRNIKGADEFKALLFSAVLRHRDRVEVVCKKYDEVRNYGISNTIIMSGICDDCGDYQISITSKRACTKIGLSQTRVGGFLNYSGCPLCGIWNDQGKNKFTYPSIK